MAGKARVISQHEVRRHFEELLLADRFSGQGAGKERRHKLLQILFARWKPSQVAPLLSAAEIAEELKLAFHNADSKDASVRVVRQDIEKLRTDLATHYRLHPSELVFEIPKPEGTHGYRVIIRRQNNTVAPDSGSVQLLFGRAVVGDRFEEIICGPSESVLFVTIAAQPALHEKIMPWFEKGAIKAGHFRVLIWRPLAKDSVVAACAQNLGQTRHGLLENVERTWKECIQLARHNPAVEVRGYTSVPTLLGVCNDRFTKVELLPFNPPAGARGANHRPAFVADRQTQPSVYEYFRQCFEDLWKSNSGPKSSKIPATLRREPLR